MAHIYGGAGKSALQKSIEKRWNTTVFLIVGFAVALGFLGFFEGILINKSLAFRWLPMAGIIGLTVAFFLCRHKYENILDEKLRSARMWHRGYEGERVIGELLEAELSDKYHVFNDVRFPGRKANIDHIVIGPSGIFVINTKNWRGIVAWAEDGETLLLNNMPDVNNTVKSALADALDIRDKLKTLTNREFFVKPILVFPLAKVFPKLDAKVDLQQDDYIIEKRLKYIGKRKELSEADVMVAVDALKALFRDDSHRGRQ